VEQDVSVVNAILSTYNDLSTSEKRIADYIINHRGEVSSLNAYEIAVKSNTSRTTMSRFVRTLGFESFSKLRLTLVRDEQGAVASMEDDGDISLDNIPDSLDYILKCKTEELSNTMAMMSPKAIARAVRTMEGADLVQVAAVGNTITMAQNAAYKLWQAGIRSSAPESSDGSVQLSLQLTNKDCLLVLSSSGYSRRLEPVMDNANDAGATTIMVTDNEDSTLAKRADIVIKTATRDRLLSKNLRFSQNSINFVVETLFLFLCHDSEEVDEKNRLFWKTAQKDREPSE
jgi:DNA-binding MurR/RpiR family transcriptional regulator